MNKEIKRIMIVFAGICISLSLLIGYLTFFEVFKASKVKLNSYNKRLWINEEGIVRGEIRDRNGLVLVESNVDDEEKIVRTYNYPNLYSHIIGYSNRTYGKSGLEKTYNKYLLDISNLSTVNDLKNIVSKNNKGNNLQLTLDHKLQEKTKALMEGRKGSVIISNPKTGEIYSMVSLPDYNVSDLDNQWKTISEDKDSPLLNRATQGVYTPGSIFKMVTAADLIESKLDEKYLCSGNIVVDGYKFKDYSDKGHGEMDLRSAFTKSCNTYFINQGMKLDSGSFLDMAERFYINREIEMDIATGKSNMPKDKIGKTEFAAMTIGQGKLGVTPLNMLLITSTIANEGVYEKFVIVDEFVYNNDRREKNLKGSSTSIIRKDIALELKSMMKNVVDSGTGKNAKSKSIEIAGKTGTAENASGKNHSWFAGFAPYEDPKFAIIVVFEEDGKTGGSSAAPVAKKLLEFANANIK